MSQHRKARGTGCGPGRKQTISREDLLGAALRLIGPNRSISTLSLREVAREAGIAPNSFYRQFRDMDELAVALIDVAGRKWRETAIIARNRVTAPDTIIRTGVQAFMEQVRNDDKSMHVILREGSTGSEAFKCAVHRELTVAQDMLRDELVRLAEVDGVGFYEPDLAAQAITRLVFSMCSIAMDSPPERDPELITQTTRMVAMIVYGAREMAARRAKKAAQTGGGDASAKAAATPDGAVTAAAPPEARDSPTPAASSHRPE